VPCGLTVNASPGLSANTAGVAGMKLVGNWEDRQVDVGEDNVRIAEWLQAYEARWRPSLEVISKLTESRI